MGKCGCSQETSKWLRDNHIIPFAFDSTGTIAPGSLTFINRSFPPSKYGRTWDSEKESKILKYWVLKYISYDTCQIKSNRS